MCEGFGCNAVGVTGCRIIDSPRERLIAIITNSLVPCNGRLPVMMVVISLFLTASAAGCAAILTGAIILGVAATLVISRLLSATFLKGEPSFFTIELPPYRTPQPLKIIVRSFCDRGIFILGRAVCAAMPAGLIIWLMTNITLGGAPLIGLISRYLDPVGRFMGLDGVILLAFILSMPANELCLPMIFTIYTCSGMITAPTDTVGLHALLLSYGWTWVTAVNTVIFSLMHWPCLTTVLTIKKETGSMKWTLLSVLLPTAAGFILCAVINFASVLL
ncbi:MAG: ferrous iron transporter B [Oscillospiraceae bacterium]|nr:ferrous iron transporter B [Oscillospiraceae bacterium]